MTIEERTKLKELIKSEIAVLEKSLVTLSELLEEEQANPGDWFTTNESKPSMEINEVSLEKTRQKISMLTRVMSKIDSPEYGICIKCRKPIPFERLKAVPSANRCVLCR
jgi:DnaK suppressor protein